jgi:DMSO/TMAO reductase YedYZ molybdopterin-dependent catalytic subunit
MARTDFARGVLHGAVAGVAAVAAMYLAAALFGVRSLPDLYQQPVLAIMPGPVFGLLIDTLQHFGKVLEEIGLAATMVAALAVLGGLAGLVAARRPRIRAGLLAGGVGWLAVSLIALPAVGDGAFGLAEGLLAPVAWLLTFLVYALALDLLPRRPEPSPDADPRRRRLLALVPAGVFLGGLGVIGAVRVPAWASLALTPPEAALKGPSPLVTPPGNFYIVSKNFHDPVIATSGWTLSVGGMVSRPLTLDYNQLRALPAVTQLVTLECISNLVGGPLLSTGMFTGVPLKDLVTMVAPQAGATRVAFESRDGYTESLDLAVVVARPDILVAWGLDGGPLPSAHGFPARVLVPGSYGLKSAKWVEKITLSSAPPDGYWERQGWAPDAPIKTTARFDVPLNGSLFRQGAIEVAGVAFAGPRGISAVEWSTDGGSTWRPAELTPSPPSPAGWTLWRATWTASSEGAYTLRVRARDGTGALQTSAESLSFPNGASGYHTIHVTVRSA